MENVNHDPKVKNVVNNVFLKKKEVLDTKINNNTVVEDHVDYVEKVI